MKKIAILLAVIVVGTLLAVSCSSTTSTPGTTQTSVTSTPAKAVIIRFASPYPPADPYASIPPSYIEDFNKKAGGRYIIEFHPAEELVTSVESLDAVRTKTVEMACWPVGPAGGVDARFGTTEWPFLYTNVRANALGLELSTPLYGAILEEKFNQKLLLTGTGGGIEIISAKKPIVKLEDLKGVLTQGLSPQLSTLIEVLGGSPVSVSGGEVYSAMQKGVIDATFIPIGALWAWGLQDVADYTTLAYLTPTADFFTINMDVWNAMPKDIQDMLTEMMQNMGQAIDDARFEQVDSNPTQLEDAGMQVTILAADERNKWKDLADDHFGPMLADMGDFGTQIKDFANQANQKYPY